MFSTFLVHMSDIEKANKVLGDFANKSSENKARVDRLFEEVLIDELEKLGIKKMCVNDELKHRFIDNGASMLLYALKDYAPTNGLQIIHDYLFELGKYSKEK